MKQVGSVFFWAFVVVTSIMLFPFAVIIWALTAPFGPRRRILHRFTCLWASLYTWVNPVWKVKVTGRDNIDPHLTYVYVANHLSLLDILIIFRLFRDFKWVSKASVFNVPLIGWNMRMNRYIPIKRGDRDSVVAMMEQCRATLKSQSSIMMFPEGTRSTAVDMLPFKPGAFDLAREAHVPIVPIAITGTRDALPKKGFVLQGRHRINVSVLPAIPASTVEELSTEQLAKKARSAIATEIDSLQAQ